MKLFSILRMAAIVLIVAAGALAGASVGTTQPSVKVRVGDGPYFDFTLFHVAHELKIDRQLGVDLQFKLFPQPPGAQLRRGDLDIIFSSPTTGFPLYKNFPDYRDFMITDIFKGFALIGRKGQVKPYSRYLAEALGNLKLAKRRFVRTELLGKSFCILKTETLGIVGDLLAQGGLKTSDIKILDFADQSLAANAFVRGACDFYTGALPQEARLLYSPEFKNKFIQAAPHQAFGPGKTGLIFYSTFASSKTWLDGNRETAKKLIAIWFRATRYLHEKPEVAAPIIANVIKVATGGVFSPKTIEGLTAKLLTFATIQEARTIYFSPKSPWYYPRAVKTLFKSAQREGVVPKGLSAEDFQAVEPLFNEVRQDRTLLRFIMKPL